MTIGRDTGFQERLYLSLATKSAQHKAEYGVLQVTGPNVWNWQTGQGQDSPFPSWEVGCKMSGLNACCLGGPQPYTH